MLPLYIGSFLFGGVLLGASIFGGGDHGDHGDTGGDGDHGDGEHGHQLPFLSLRFWSFAVAFFGLTGAALTLVGTGAGLTAALSGVLGLGAGFGSARVLQGLARGVVGQVQGATTHVGREGRLLLPVAPGQRGKLRVQIGGSSTDLLAETEAAEPLAIGETVLIVGIRGNVAIVERSPGALPPLSRKETT